MTAPMKGPTTATIKRLFAVSGNRCAFPRCTTSIVLDEKVVGEICHIRARSPEGPRFDPAQTPDERHAFNNLILLCGTHHSVVDDDVEAYNVERLVMMKSRHEQATGPMSEADAAMGGNILSLNQSGGITAQTVSVENAHFYAAGDGEQTAPRQAQAMAMLGPELARTLVNQIRILDRAVANFICASAGHASPGDHWTSFRLSKPTLYPGVAQVRELDATNGAFLAEFYSLIEEIDDMIAAWRAAELVWDCNAWNVLMQKVEKSVAAGIAAADVFCPGRQYDPTMPAGGTIAERAAISSNNMRKALEAHIARFAANR